MKLKKGDIKIKKPFKDYLDWNLDVAVDFFDEIDIIYRGLNQKEKNMNFFLHLYPECITEGYMKEYELTKRRLSDVYVKWLIFKKEKDTYGDILRVYKKEVISE